MARIRREKTYCFEIPESYSELVTLGSAWTGLAFLFFFRSISLFFLKYIDLQRGKMSREVSKAVFQPLLPYLLSVINNELGKFLFGPPLLFAIGGS